jgi:ferredoxin
MPVIRFVREGRDVECYPGENLREVALREGIELYGLKGRLGNCGGCGQCITCFVDVVPAGAAVALSPRTGVEERKLRRRPESWRLACQALVEHSLLVVTRPQAGDGGLATLLEGALATPLPTGPTAWPEPPDSSEASSDEPPSAAIESGSSGELASPAPSATSGEDGPQAPKQR